MKIASITMPDLCTALSTSTITVLLALAPRHRNAELFEQLASKTRVISRWNAVGRERLQLDSGSEVRIVTLLSMRGMSADLVVVDVENDSDALAKLLLPVTVAKRGRVVSISG